MLREWENARNNNSYGILFGYGGQVTLATYLDWPLVAGSETTSL